MSDISGRECDFPGDGSAFLDAIPHL